MLRFIACLSLVIFFSGCSRTPGVEWQPYTPEVLQQARLSGRPTILDFYADWCFPCQRLEKVTYRDPRVVEALSGMNRIKVDATDYEAPGVREIMALYDIKGLPSLLFFDSSGTEMTSLRRFAYVSPSGFLDYLSRYQHLLFRE